MFINFHEFMFFVNQEAKVCSLSLRVSLSAWRVLHGDVGLDAGDAFDSFVFLRSWNRGFHRIS